MGNGMRKNELILMLKEKKRKYSSRPLRSSALWSFASFPAPRYPSRKVSRCGIHSSRNNRARIRVSNFSPSARRMLSRMAADGRDSTRKEASSKGESQG